MANKVDEGRNVGRPEGGDSMEYVKLNRSRQIRLNPEFKMPTIAVKEIDNTKKEFRCCMCGQTYTKQSGNFLSGGSSILWRGNNGYTPFCKSCGETLMGVFTSFYGGNEEHALRHLCQIFDWYYCDLASSMTLSQVHRGKSRAVIYPSKACTINVTRRGTSFLDTVRDEYNGSIPVHTATTADGEDGVFDEPEFVVTRALIKKWGVGYKPNEYEFLEEQEADWHINVECKTKAQAELIRNICVAQLNIRRAQMSGSGKEVTDSMKTFQDLLGSANLKPTQQNDNALAEHNTFGTLIKKWETEDPIPEPDPEWADVDGIKKLVRTFFLGHLSKALHIKNDAADEYEREMSRYTVHKPTYDKSADDAPVDIFDAAQDKKGGDES